MRTVNFAGAIASGHPRTRREAVQELPATLTTLDLADNRLTTLDVSPMTQLQTLDVDCNSLSEIVGLASARSLETLSWRDQRLSRGSSIEFCEAADVRHLALSGNIISATFNFPHSLQYVRGKDWVSNHIVLGRPSQQIKQL